MPRSTSSPSTPSSSAPPRFPPWASASSSATAFTQALARPRFSAWFARRFFFAGFRCFSNEPQPPDKGLGACEQRVGLESGDERPPRRRGADHSRRALQQLAFAPLPIGEVARIANENFPELRERRVGMGVQPILSASAFSPLQAATARAPLSLGF